MEKIDKIERSTYIYSKPSGNHIVAPNLAYFLFCWAVKSFSKIGQHWYETFYKGSPFDVFWFCKLPKLSLPIFSELLPVVSGLDNFCLVFLALPSLSKFAVQIQDNLIGSETMWIEKKSLRGLSNFIKCYGFSSFA